MRSYVRGLADRQWARVLWLCTFPSPADDQRRASTGRDPVRPSQSGTRVGQDTLHRPGSCGPGRTDLNRPRGTDRQTRSGHGKPGRPGTVRLGCRQRSGCTRIRRQGNPQGLDHARTA